MFKSARWRGDRIKIKIEFKFKLQFSVTQVPESAADSLTISVAPAGDVGKPSLKSEKASVRDGICRWEDPVYLIIKFDRDSKTGKTNSKIYKFLVSTGLTKAIVLGEVSIDFSEYAEASKPSNLSLPLKNSNSSAILHVCIQRLQASANKREVEELEEKIASIDPDMKSFLSNGDADESAEIDPTSVESMDKSLESLKVSGNDRGSSGSDITLSSSESCYEVESRTDKFHQDQLAVLARRADVSEMELQTLRKHIVKESKKGQDLSREIVSLKEERDLLKLECEKLKSFQLRVSDSNAKNKLQVDGGGDLRAILEEIRQELNYEKDMNANLRVQLEKTQESNNELILAVRDLEHMLEKKEDEEQKALENLVKEHINGDEALVLEQKLGDFYGKIEIYRKDKDELEMQIEQLALDYEIMKQENHDLSYKLEQSQLQEQLKLQYECPSSMVAINELESHIDDLEEELANRTTGFEADIEALTLAKVEQEKQTIRAEEALRKTVWKNAKTAEKIQEEFRKLSVQMMFAFGQMSEELETKSKQVEDQTKTREEERTNFSRQIKKLENENERLRIENEKLINQEEDLRVQFRQMEKSVGESLIFEANGKMEATSDEEERGPEISIKRKVKLLSERDDELRAEVEVLRETNKSMESELIEMQERYSEISLKFAEVEGERQKLVMTLRFLKNSKKGF